ncbi:hypothetical protein D9757_006099 [Collybiopsis confluens]|uniref:RNA-dependent RNA polymerase n=1 Tax=Collybiopsis confluens TaxID=2823264 RepID=A0A8H5HHM8_9AGAR|nr:hypothetical protein D9757_006099 [Collybiopsis confluens]
MKKSPKTAYYHAQNDHGSDDVLGFKMSKDTAEATRASFNSPMVTPGKAQKKIRYKPEVGETIRGCKPAADVSPRTSPSSLRSTSTSIRTQPQAFSPPLKDEQNQGNITIISSDEEDAAEAESNSDSDNIVSPKTSMPQARSREYKMTPIASFPPPIPRNTLTKSSAEFVRDAKPQAFPGDQSTPSFSGLSADSWASQPPSSSASLQTEIASTRVQPQKPFPERNSLLLSLKVLFPSGPNETLHLQYHQIAFNSATQPLFDNPRGPVSWGTQFKLARGVQLEEWKWIEVQEKIHHFAGKSDAEAMHLVDHVMKNQTPPEIGTSEIGREFDREQLAILEGVQRGLGLMSADNWFGGQIQQIATLEETRSEKLRLRLEPLEMRRSTRLSRKLGSRRVLQVRIAEDFLRDETGKTRMVNFFTRKFILNGRVFVPTPPKENGLYLVEINEDFGREPSDTFGDSRRKSLGEILEWHNPVALNSNQPISKYAARAALALSNSVPALIFNVRNIHFIDDIIASDCLEKKPPAHKVLTDGCGFINQAALKAITESLNYPSRPTAVQGRIAGSKGLWTLHPFDTSDIPQIWIRDSQRKIIYPGFDRNQRHHLQKAESEFDLCHGHYTTLDRAHCIFDLLHATLPAPTSGSTVSISKQSILNLWANGVEETIFKDLMKEGLEAIIKPFFQWDSGPTAMPALWDAINKTGKVSYIRTSRLAAGRARALGLAGRSYKKDGIPEDDDTTARNDISGEPSGLHEKAIELVQAGFHPSKDPILWDSLKSIVKLALTTATKKCSIPLPEGSAVQAYVIPDPLGLLNPDEIFYRSSTPMKDVTTQTLFNVVTGDVLIGRYPFRVRSDIQKVKAVDIPGLYRYSDVIIVPTKPSSSVQGLVSLMSMCSGGDHDGDELLVIWEQVLVEAFEASSLVVPPEELASNFENQVKQVDEFLGELDQLSPTIAQGNFISTMLGSLADSGVGLYDSFHERAVRLYGYDSQQAERLAFLFNELLDASKTGKILRTEVRTNDKAQDSTFQKQLKERKSNSGFIYDNLEAFGQEFLATHLKRFESLKKSTEKSNILLQSYRKAQQRYLTTVIPPDAAMHLADYVSRPEDLGHIGKSLQLAYRSDLHLIEKHVDKAYHLFAKKLGSLNEEANFNNGSQVNSKEKKPRKRLMEDVVLSYASDIRGLTGIIPDIEHVKASYAYEKGKSYKFAELVAFRSLCEIQVAALSEGGAPCSRILDQTKSISGGARRLF